MAGLEPAALPPGRLAARGQQRAPSPQARRGGRARPPPFSSRPRAAPEGTAAGKKEVGGSVPPSSCPTAPRAGWGHRCPLPYRSTTPIKQKGEKKLARPIPPPPPPSGSCTPCGDQCGAWKRYSLLLRRCSKHSWFYIYIYIFVGSGIFWHIVVLLNWSGFVYESIRNWGNRGFPYVYVSAVLPVFQLGRLAGRRPTRRLPMLIHDPTHINTVP